TPSTRTGPSASTASLSTSALSTPPENATTTRSSSRSRRISVSSSCRIVAVASGMGPIVTWGQSSVVVCENLFGLVVLGVGRGLAATPAEQVEHQSADDVRISQQHEDDLRP